MYYYNICIEAEKKGIDPTSQPGRSIENPQISTDLEI